MSNPLSGLLELMAPAAPAGPVAWRTRDATVHTLVPLMVVLDGPDETSVAPSKAPLVGDLSVGDRVMCLFIGRQLTIMGAYGGTGGSAGDLDAKVKALVEADSRTRAAMDARYLGQVSSIPGIFNAATYGAVGDGLANDTAAIQATFDACSAAGGGIVLVPAGHYRIMVELTWHGNITYVLYGARLFRGGVFSFASNLPKTNSTTTRYNGPGNITILGGELDAVGQTHNSGYANTFTWAHARRITMRDVTLSNTAGAHAVEFDGIDWGVMENCHFLGFFDTGSRDFSEAVQIDAASGGRGAPDNTLCRNIIMRGCFVGASDALPAWPRGIGSHSAYVNDTHKFVRVEGTTFEGMLSMAVRGYGWDHVTIDDNFVDGGCSSNAIEVSTSAPGGAGGGDAYVKNVQITNNQIVNVLEDGIFMEVKGTKNIQRAIIDGNIIDNPGKRGVYLLGSVDNASVRDNVISAPTGAGIALSGTGGTTVTGNRVRKSTTTAAALLITEGTTGAVHYLNDFRGYGSSAVDNSGSGTLTPVPNII